MPSRRRFLRASATAASALALVKTAPGVVLGEAADQQRAAGAAAAPAGAAAKVAAIHAFEQKMLKARPVPMGKVRVTGGPLKRAQDVTAAYLLALDPDRMMAFYRVRAGLKQKGEPYAGWDGSGRQLTGHIAGHHLSAVSLMFQATGDPKFKARADYLVREMKEVQDARGDGYLGAIITADNTDGRDVFKQVSKGEIRSGGFDLNGLWSPWYTLQKTFSGLRDAYRDTGSRMALDVSIKFATWAENVLKPMSDAQVQKMLLTEHGGMNEILADLYADTGDTRWLDLSLRFEHHAFTDALKRHQDNLDGKHGNCQIPKLIGSAKRYGYTGDPQDIMAASYFWDRVVQHHSYATGGHGLAEYFGPPDQLSPRVDGRAAETCNVYNMVKLTRRLFSLRPDPYYADFQERALFNHILGSIDPEDGRTSYMVPVGRGVQQEYQDMQRSFTCCVGTGMESHALHGDGLYYESADTVWTSLFVPSTATLANGATLTMETGFPDGDTAKMTFAMPAPKAFTLMVRRPVWAGDGFRISVNGAPLEQPLLATLRAGGAGGRYVAADDPRIPPSTWVEIKRTWKAGDTVELAIPKALHLEPTPDNKAVTAIMWGPLCLAADHGAPPAGGRGGGGAAPRPAIPALVAGGRPLDDWIKPAARAGDFVATGVARVPATTTPAGNVTLAPFYRTHRKIYQIYFDLLTPAEFDDRSATMTADAERRRKITAATVSFLQPGDATLEKEYNYQTSDANRPAPRANGRTSRAGGGWFSYDLPVDPTTEMALILTYFNEVGLPPTTATFDISVDGTVVGSFQQNLRASGYYDETYTVPIALTRGKARSTVKFQAGPDGRIAPVFGVRIVKALDIK